MRKRKYHALRGIMNKAGVLERACKSARRQRCRNAFNRLSNDGKALVCMVGQDPDSKINRREI